MTCITYVSFSHCTCNVSYHVIMSFDTVVEEGKMLGRVDLPFENYVVPPKTLYTTIL